MTFARDEDLDGRMTALDVFDGITPVLDLDYAYDLASRITGIDDTGGGARGRTYTYDELHRLTQARELAPGGAPVTLQTDYTYDAAGNRTAAAVGAAAESYAYDPASNRLQTVTAAAVVRTLGYSASGNTDSDDNGLGTVLTNLYDSTDRLVEVKNGAATVATYLHNSNGQRVAKTVGASTTHYVHAGGALIAEADGATGATTAEYIAFNGINLAWIATGSVYFVHADHLGTPQMLTDGTGAVVWDASYRPFGAATVSGSVAFNLRFPGQYFDAETGLHYNMMRDYDPGLGRYVQSDPIGLSGGWNTYAYVGGNPVMRVDPEGLWSMQMHREITAEAAEPLCDKAAPLAYFASQWADMDRRDGPTQAPENAHWHAMRSPNDTVAESLKKYNDYVQERMSAPCGTGPIRYRPLGEAIHAVQDSYSPLHRDESGNPIIWGGTFAEMGAHSKEDRYMTEALRITIKLKTAEMISTYLEGCKCK